MRYTWKEAGIIYSSIRNALRKKNPYLRSLSAHTDRYYYIPLVRASGASTNSLSHQRSWKRPVLIQPE